MAVGDIAGVVVSERVSIAERLTTSATSEDVREFVEKKVNDVLGVALEVTDLVPAADSDFDCAADEVIVEDWETVSE